MNSMARPRFSQLLMRDKLVTEDQVRSALQEQVISGELLGSILFNRRILTEDQVVKYLSQVYGVPGVMVSRATPKDALKRLIPEEIAQQYCILPLKVENKILTLACVNPQDFRMIQEVQFMTGCKVVPLIAMQVTLKDRSRMYYGGGLHAGISLEKEPVAHSQDLQVTSLAANLEDSFSAPAPQKGSPNYPKNSSVQEFALTPKSEMAEVLSDDLNQALEEMDLGSTSVSPDWQNITSRPRTILVVDDDAAIRKLLEDTLKAKNYHVATACRGREAIEKIQNVRPDLILLDAMLPEIHGFTICRNIKDSDKYRNIPIIIITAVYTGWRFQLDVKEQYGADEVIEKPFKIATVLEKIKQLLDESETISGKTAERDLELTRKAEDVLQRGVEALKVDNVAGAKELFEAGIKIDPLHPLLHYYLGKCCEKDNNLFGAMASFEKSTELDPYLFPAVKDLGILYQKNGFKRKAIEMWERALQVCPREDIREKIKQNLIKLL